MGGRGVGAEVWGQGCGGRGVGDRGMGGRVLGGRGVGGRGKEGGVGRVRGEEAEGVGRQGAQNLGVSFSKGEVERGTVRGNTDVRERS